MKLLRTASIALLVFCHGAQAQQEPIFLQPEASFDLYAPTTSMPQQQSLPAAAPQPQPAAPLPKREIDESVFGARLFLGHFARQSVRGFNPDYVISSGDIIDLKLWGAVEAVLRLPVDSQGNIFVPKLGPVRVSNVRNAELNELVRSRVMQVYRENVGVYASLATAEPVKVFVTGNVVEPGLYGAYASDSVLHFLDQAGGIDTDTGSFLDVRVQRGGRTIRKLNLYDFLLRGELPLVQFQSGDTIVVGPIQATARVTGLVQKPQRFEFPQSIALSQLLDLAGLKERATHVQILRHQSAQRQAEYLSLGSDLGAVRILAGDEVAVMEDRRNGDIIASLEGEFEGLSQQVLPYEANLADLLSSVALTELSNPEGVQLYRQSVAKRQKEVLEEMLQKLEQAVLTARSGTREEAQLRTQEASLILKFVERARTIQPKGRVVLHQGYDPEMIQLQDRDVVRIPRKVQTVAVQGEVFFPSSFVWQEGKSVDDYLEQAGGLSQYGNRDRIFLVRANGEMLDARQGWFSRVRVQPGDEIMVLPQIDSKKFQFSKDLVQIIYQLALSAGVVLRL